MGLDTAPNASQLIGTTNALYQAGGLIGALMSGLTSDRFGRRGAIAIAGTIAVMGGILQTASVHIAMFMVARLVTGLGIGKLASWRLYYVKRFKYIDWRRKHHDCHTAYPSGALTTQKPRSSCRVPWSFHSCGLHFSRMDRRRVLPCAQCNCAMASTPSLPISRACPLGCHYLLYP